MSPALDFALTENSARTTTETTRTPDASSGTNGSNPVPSSGESANFRFLVASARGRKRPSLAPSARTGPAANRDVTGAAAEALQRAVEDHLAETGRGGAQDTCPGEAECRGNEQNARRQQPRHCPGQRYYHDIGDQADGLHPGDLVGGGRQPPLGLS